MTIEVTLGGDAATVRAIQAVRETLVAEGVPGALSHGDPTLWGPETDAVAANRLGWLDLPLTSRELLPEITNLVEMAQAEGLDHVVLAGMGGSSLAAEVICATADVPLTVLDTTDPHQVRRALGLHGPSPMSEVPMPGDGGSATSATQRTLLDRTLVVVSSKSGGTIETDSHRRIFEKAFTDAGIDPAERIVVVTDPESPLEQAAIDAGYQVILADPNVGGRYSALSAFGLVPSALAGANVRELLDDAAEVRPRLAGDEDNPGLDLGALLGAQSLSGRDKMILRDRLTGIAGLPDWIEQLIAESTGKSGRGILPVVGADAAEAADQFTIDIGPGEPPSVDGPLGAQFLVWEYATAIAGRVLGIDPFDQPNVAESKENTTRILREAGDGPLPTGLPLLTDGPVEVYGEVPGNAKDLVDILTYLLRAVPEHGYLAIMAYLDREAAFDVTLPPHPDGSAPSFEELTEAWAAADIATLRPLLDQRTDRPVTFGWGPRFLHSTGQFHKGGPQMGVFLQITGAVTDDVEVPGRPYTLGRLQMAQALGDLRALASRGRPAVRLHLTDRSAGVRHLLTVAEEL